MKRKKKIQMTKPLLIEIAVEELPAIPFLKELPNIEKKWLNMLKKKQTPIFLKQVKTTQQSAENNQPW